MPITYAEDPDAPIVEIWVSGKVTLDDFNEIAPKVQAFIDRHGTIKLIEVIEDLKGFEISMLLPGIKFDIQNLRHISHVALVSDIAWMSPLTKAASALMSTQLRTFDLADLGEARNWIRSSTST